MDYKELFIKRHELQGESFKESYRNQSKVMLTDKILNSYDRYDVRINFKNEQPCIVKDIENFKTRKFMFIPDTKVFLGDYIEHENFTYLALVQNTNDILPYIEGHHCNYDFPVRTEEIQSNEVVGKYPNGQPIYKTQKITHTIPCVVTAKIYSQVDNSILPMPDGAITVYMPYRPEEPMPERDQEVVVHDAQYYVADIIKTNILKFSGVERGYLELRLQRMQKNVSTKA